MVGRRGFLGGLFAGAAAAGGNILSPAGQGIGREASSHSNVLGSNWNFPNTSIADNAAWPPELSPEAKALMARIDRSSRKIGARFMPYPSGIDADIASMKSVSASSKIRMQLAREELEKTFVEKMRNEFEKLAGRPWYTIRRSINW